MQSQPSPDLTDAMLAAVHRELRSLAAAYMRQERPDHTLQATALMHEAYLRLRQREGAPWKTSAHFVGHAANTMRQVLVDHARTRQTDKRGGQSERGSMDALQAAQGASQIDLCALDDALHALGRDIPRAARVVEMRFFGGLTIPEVAEILEVTERTVARDWRYAQAWLRRAMTVGVTERRARE